MKTEEQVKDWLEQAIEHDKEIDDHDDESKYFSAGIIEALKWVLGIDQ